MIRSRTVQLIFTSIYCALGVVGIFACIGFFALDFSADFYIFFTNLSNFLCIGVMFAELIQTAKRKGDGYISAVPHLKFIGVLAILLTFMVFNILLAPTRELSRNFELSSILFHIVLPVMYVADWFLFRERKKITWKFPLMSAAFPLAYLAFIYIRAAIHGFDATCPNLYPYFFLNLDTQGVGGVVRWCLIFLVGFMAIGYLFYAIDRFWKPRKPKSPDVPR